MKSTQILIGGLLGCLLAGGLSVALWNNNPAIHHPATPSGTSADDSATADTPAHRVSAPFAGPSAAEHAVTPEANAPLPPWRKGATLPQEAATRSPAAQAAGRNANRDTPRLEDIQRQLTALLAHGRQPTIAEVDHLLAELQRSQGSNEVGGINLAALRDNLARTKEIQQLAKEIQRLAEQPGKPDVARMQQLVAQIQQQQAGIKADVRVNPDTPLGYPMPQTPPATGKK